MYDLGDGVYHTMIGRFTSADPIELDGGDANFYRYVWNQVTKFFDPEGLMGGLGMVFTPPPSPTPSPDPTSSPGDFLVPVPAPIRPKSTIPTSSGPRGQTSQPSGPSCG